MTHLKLLGTTALALGLAAPAMAQEISLHVLFRRQ